MLTRCEKGMVILSSRKFLEKGASRTLVGKMAKEWENHRPGSWVNWRSVAEGTVDLPGRLAPKVFTFEFPYFLPY